MKKDFFKVLTIKLYPIILMSTVMLSILFIILGFALNNSASNIFFLLSFVCLILYVPSFLLISKLQNAKWFKKYNRIFTLKYAEKVNREKMKEKAKEFLKELGIENK